MAFSVFNSIAQEKIYPIPYQGPDGLTYLHHQTHKPAFNKVFESGGQFSEGFAWVQKRKKFGYIGANGATTIAAVYAEARDFSNGKAAVCMDGQVKSCGYLNKKGNVVIPLLYSEITDFDQNRAWVKKDGEWFLINDKGENLTARGLEKGSPFIGGLAAVKKDGHWGAINLQGSEIIPAKYNYLEVSEDGWLAACNDTACGYLDQEGKIVIPFTYQQTQPFSDGLGVVKNEEGWSFIDATGKSPFPCPYQKVYPFRSKVANVLDNGRWVLIDQTGKEISTLPEGWHINQPYSNWPKPITFKNKHGFVSADGQLAIPFRYRDVSPFDGRYAWVCLGKTCGWVDRGGEEYIPWTPKGQFPQTSLHQLDSLQIDSMPSDSIVLMMNEILDRHGYKFSNPNPESRLRAYEKPSPEQEKFIMLHLSKTERANLNLLRKKMAGIPEKQTE